jgi:multidrug resistance efflux pump
LYSTSNSKIISLKSLPIELKTLKNPEELKKDMENELQNKKYQIEDLKVSIKKAEDDFGLTNLTSKDKLEQENKKVVDKKAEIENYKIEIEKTKLNNIYELESKKKSISENEIQISEVERNLKKLLNDSSNQGLILVQNDLKQAKISLENEIKKLETYELKAPFDGVITKLDYQV